MREKPALLPSGALGTYRGAPSMLTPFPGRKEPAVRSRRVLNIKKAFLTVSLFDIFFYI